ncbi:hypothetical protein BT96DRAFT_588250 [Gymnopus androsaceus JB14]|uniref:Uncharacterized protein n=1 Tax=Gymnopus androsaceus JB14 TaxID=1447944 RepID=A0A6A4IB24_9AGAR|nr:hypothetical protein BT96DRAFT_588250 [Gymnopus androsaceus JB14]
MTLADGFTFPHSQRTHRKGIVTSTGPASTPNPQNLQVCSLAVLSFLGFAVLASQYSFCRTTFTYV